MNHLELAVVVFGLLVLGFAAVGGGLGRRFHLTAPLVFVAAGLLLSLVYPEQERKIEAVKLLAEVTLVLVLFHDAAQVRPRDIGADRGLVLRLLLVGLPLTILLGVLAGRLLFPGAPLMLMLLLAAALAPTDAGLGAATVLNPVVPERVRRLLNVESGLNDGLATPVVLFAVAALAGEAAGTEPVTVASALVDIAIGVAVGAAVGFGGGRLLDACRGRGLVFSGTIGTLMLPLVAYFGALLLSGNGFVAAFVAGTAYLASDHAAEPSEWLELTEEVSTLLGFAVWLVVGLLAAPLVGDVGWRELLFAVLALTVLRMLPVAIALLGTGLRPPTVAFIGWFGPRGLASVVFALLALEELPASAELSSVLVTIVATVLLSVLAHGLSADPLAARYGAWAQRTQPPVELAGSTPVRVPRGQGSEA